MPKERFSLANQLAVDGPTDLCAPQRSRVEVRAGELVSGRQADGPAGRGKAGRGVAGSTGGPMAGYRAGRPAGRWAGAHHGCSRGRTMNSRVRVHFVRRVAHDVAKHLCHLHQELHIRVPAPGHGHQHGGLAPAQIVGNHNLVLAQRESAQRQQVCQRSVVQCSTSGRERWAGARGDDLAGARAAHQLQNTSTQQ